MICSVEHCKNEIRWKGLCTKCYYRIRAAKKRASDPDFKKRQTLATARWKKRNQEKDSAHQSAYRQKHSKRLKEYFKVWINENRDSYNAYQATRKKRVKLATPAWADLDVIRSFYFNCPKGYHVDHIIPLSGKDVCGLHVENNLQYLPALENLKKSNKI
jgi:hypothetical protein